MGKPERHLETVVLEDVRNGDAPEQGELESSAGRRRRDQMTRPDAGHHQDDAGSEALEQRPDVGARQFQLCEWVPIACHGTEPVAFARSGTGAW